jgi:hypothetical protein
LQNLAQKLSRKWQSAIATATFCHRIVPCWRIGYPLALWRARRVCRAGRFEPAEAFRLGLFQPRSRRRQHVEYVSRRQLTKVQEALNPVAWAPLLKNKDLFYHYCLAVEAPIPRMYAIVHARLPGWTYTGHLPRTRDDWAVFLDGSLPAEFVIKPAEGAYGRGFNIFHRTGTGCTDAAGTYREVGDLYDVLVSDAPGRYIVQERLHNHPELIRLSGTEALQTVRIITLIDNDGQVRLLHAHLKIIEGGEIVDTFLQGLTGNIEAPIDLRHGALAVANRIPGTGSEVLAIRTHPGTGIAFEGFRLPFWAEACRLARQTALKFIPVRTIGWDVALTPDGPVVVEGNIWWDPPNQHGDMAEIFRVLSDPSLPRIQRSEPVAADGDRWRNLFTAHDRA